MSATISSFNQWSERTVRDLRQVVKQDPLLQHPFLEAARRGQLALSELRLFAIQEMFVSTAFPALMAEVVCKIPYRLEAVRYPLVANMFEECGERNQEDSHPRLLRRLACALGAEESEIDDAKPLPETNVYLERLFDLCRRRTFIDGLATIVYGNEYLVLFEYPILKKACKSAGCSDTVLQFFDVNIHADADHTKNLERVIIAQDMTDENRASVISATNDSLTARGLFYDGLQREIGLLAPPPLTRD